MQVFRSEMGKKFMALDEGFAASFLDGKWVEGTQFNGYYLEKEFFQITSPYEAEDIIKWAKSELGLNNETN